MGVATMTNEWDPRDFEDRTPIVRPSGDDPLKTLTVVEINLGSEQVEKLWGLDAAIEWRKAVEEASGA
jgi:hypothetical protein